jgi:hypothetical protein|tara:strand:+ start:628 stop:852 length:225 start_codon:yes stop_codon:yes gene_type:complete
MPNINVICDQWNKPMHWVVTEDDESAEISDEDGDFVVSSITQTNLTELIEAHLQKIRLAVAMNLLMTSPKNNES